MQMAIAQFGRGLGYEIIVMDGNKQAISSLTETELHRHEFDVN